MKMKMRVLSRILLFLSISVLLASGQALVADTSTETKSIGLVMQDDYMDKGDEYALNIVSNIFVDLPQFALIEREELNTLFDEKALKQFIGDIEGSGIHELEGLDLVGVVDHFHGREAAINDVVTQVHTITVRLIDVANGKVLGTADSRRGSLTPATTLDLAGSYLKKNLMELLGKIFGMGGYVIKIDGSQIYVDLGQQQGINEGDKLEIVQQGESLVHPVTGEVLPGPETVVSTLKVESSSLRLSICSLKEGAIPSIGDSVRYKARNTEKRKNMMDKIKFWKGGFRR